MAAYYTFEDLSGPKSDGIKSDNPYQDVIDACNDDAAQIQARYDTHRTKRNAQQREKLLSEDFPGVTVDEILAKLESPSSYPDYRDPRHCLVFWARPTERVKKLIGQLQKALKDVVPNLWLMPESCLHMTALEITHSLTAAEIDSLVAQISPHAEQITGFTRTHRARLVKPMISFDAQALALSYLPACDGEGDAYTYHHLRRDLHTAAAATGVRVASRYVIPSAHLTIGRFITKQDFETAEGNVDHEKVATLVARIDVLNRWLEQEYWTDEGEEDGGEWVVGDEKGLDFRKGALWYGGGETIILGSAA